jgi:hypothetical protein
MLGGSAGAIPGSSGPPKGGFQSLLKESLPVDNTPPGFKSTKKFEIPKPANEDAPPTKDIFDKIVEATTPLSKFSYLDQLEKQKESIQIV